MKKENDNLKDQVAKLRPMNHDIQIQVSKL